jgi:Domain of unknown function (DUF4258)
VIERFDWTDHAEGRARQRKFDRKDVELAIRRGHDCRGRNDGPADWLVRGRRFDGGLFEVVYDHPTGADLNRVRVVSVWDFEDRGVS